VISWKNVCGSGRSISHKLFSWPEQLLNIDEELIRSEARKGILRYYGTGMWKGDL